MADSLLERVPLGGSDLLVSRLALGTYRLGQRSCAPEALDLLGHAYNEHGLNFFDTSDNYTAGELLLGMALRDGTIPRDDVVIATKTGLAGSIYEGLEFDAVGRKYDTRPERIVRKVEGSLRVLGVDAIDLYQVHVHDPQVEAAEIVEVMQKLKDQGKIRHWGISNYDRPEEVAEIVAASVDEGAERPITLQNYHNLIAHPSDNDPSIILARELGMTVLAFSPLYHGQISEGIIEARDRQQLRINGLMLKIKLSPQEEDELKAAREDHRVRQELSALSDYAADHGHNTQRLAIAWLLRQEATIPLLGTYKKEHLDDLVRAASWELDDDGEALVERTIKKALNLS